MADGEGFAAYLSELPDEARTALLALRQVIRGLAPGATEGISYRIPTFYLKGRPLVYMAAFKGHYSLYPIPALPEEQAAMLAPYVAGKGTLRFDYALPLPEEVVRVTVAGLRAALEARVAVRAGKRPQNTPS